MDAACELVVVDVAEAAMRANSFLANSAADVGAAAAAADQPHRQRGVGLRAAHGLRFQDGEAERGGRAGSDPQKITAVRMVCRFMAVLIILSIVGWQ